MTFKSVASGASQTLLRDIFHTESKMNHTKNNRIWADTYIKRHPDHLNYSPYVCRKYPYSSRTGGKALHDRKQVLKTYFCENFRTTTAIWRMRAARFSQTIFYFISFVEAKMPNLKFRLSRSKFIQS